jgi:ABC-2 type transport system permease protein
MTGRLWAVVRREYLERVRSKAFIIATILGPVLMVGIMIVPVFIAGKGGRLLRVAILDASGALQSEVEEALREARRGDTPRFDVRPLPGDGTAAGREPELKAAVLAGRLDGYLLLPEDTVSASRASYYGRTVSNRMDLQLMEWRIQEVVVAHRVADAGLDPGRVKELTRDLDLRTIRLSEEGEREDQGLGILLPIILLMILYTSILMWGQVVMTSIIEEKSSRVIEVVASGVAPTSLLAGKLLGVGAAGLTQFLVWSLSLLGASVLATGPLVAGLSMPQIAPLVPISFVAFFLLGFAFYASLYAGIGAAVNTVQEAQNFVFPIVIPLVMGLVCFPVVIESPDGGLAVTLSLIPFLTPLLMFLRIVVLPPPAWQITLSLVLLAASIVAAVWLAARVYRVGILMYGKKPTFPELMRWVRQP